MKKYLFIKYVIESLIKKIKIFQVTLFEPIFFLLYYKILRSKIMIGTNFWNIKKEIDILMNLIKTWSFRKENINYKKCLKMSLVKRE